MNFSTWIEIGAGIIASITLTSAITELSRVFFNRKKEIISVKFRGKMVDLPLNNPQKLQEIIEGVNKVQVFISYSQTNKKIAKRIAMDLKLHGIESWLPDEMIHLGDNILNKIEEGLENSNFFIVLISKESENSEWFMKELELMRKIELESDQPKIIPILLDDSQLPDFFPKDRVYGTIGDYNKLIEGLVKRSKSEQNQIL